MQETLIDAANLGMHYVPLAAGLTAPSGYFGARAVRARPNESDQDYREMKQASLRIGTPEAVPLSGLAVLRAEYPGRSDAELLMAQQMTRMMAMQSGHDGMGSRVTRETAFDLVDDPPPDAGAGAAPPNHKAGNDPFAVKLAAAQEVIQMANQYKSAAYGSGHKAASDLEEAMLPYTRVQAAIPATEKQIKDKVRDALAKADALNMRPEAAVAQALQVPAVEYNLPDNTAPAASAFRTYNNFKNQVNEQVAGFTTGRLIQTMYNASTVLPGDTRLVGLTHPYDRDSDWCTRRF